MATVTRAQKLRLGVFLATALGILVVGIAALAGRTALQDRDTYVIRFESRAVSFSGLEVGSPVKYSGVDIGHVRFLRVAPDDVGVIEVGIAVDGGTPIAEDSVASVASLGITGLKYIELSRGSAKTRVREPGEIIPSGESLMDELSVRAGSIAERLDDLLESIQKMAGDETGDDVQRILGESAGILEDNRPQIAEILSNVNSMTADLGRIAESGVSVAGKTDELMTRLNEVGESLHYALAPESGFMQSMQKTEKLIDRLDMIVLRSENDLDVAMRHLRDATANLNEFSLAIRDDPRLLLGGREPSGRTDGGRSRER